MTRSASGWQRSPLMREHYSVWEETKHDDISAEVMRLAIQQESNRNDESRYHHCTDRVIVPRRSSTVIGVASTVLDPIGNGTKLAFGDGLGGGGRALDAKKKICSAFSFDHPAS